jgi:hypothetical protein
VALPDPLGRDPANVIAHPEGERASLARGHRAVQAHLQLVGSGARVLGAHRWN